MNRGILIAVGVGIAIVAISVGIGIGVNQDISTESLPTEIADQKETSEGKTIKVEISDSVGTNDKAP